MTDMHQLRSEAVDAASIFSLMLSRLRAVEHFAVGRRVLSIVALGRLSTAPIRQVLFGHAHTPDRSASGGEGQVRSLLMDAASKVERDDPSLQGVFTDVLVPDAFQSRFLDQSAFFAAEILGRLSSRAVIDDFGRWFSDRLDQIVLAGPAATEVGTPPPVTELMTAIARIEKGNRVYDPCCGLGGLLALAGQRAEDTLLRGQELHPISWALSTLRLRLLGFDARIERGDALRSLEQIVADRVICDPPLGSYLPPLSEGKLDVNRIGGAAPRRLDALFLEKCWHAMSPAGRAVVLVSQPTLVRRGAEHTLRNMLLDEGVVETVISLPTSAVAFTSVELALIVLDRSKFHDRVRFIDGGLMHAALGSRSSFEVEALLSSYAATEARPWTRYVQTSKLHRDNNLLPRRHIEVTVDRPSVQQLLIRSELLKQRADEREKKIKQLLRRVGASDR